MKYSIEICNITKDFDENRALDNITIKIKNKKCVGYLGPNGSGKTTTMKILTNLLSPSSGETYINGINVQKDYRNALYNVGAIIEEPFPYPLLTPRQILSFFGELRGINKSYLHGRVEEILKIVNLFHSIDTKTGKFSTGMKQRLNIAQALLSDPEVLILDEPTLGLDPKGMREFRNIILEIKKEKTIFLSSHLLHQIEMISDEVVLIGKGKIFKHDTLENIKKIIKSNLIQIHLNKPLKKDSLTELNTLNYISSLNWEDGILYLKYDNEKVAPRDIMKDLFKMGLEMDSFIPKEANLEDIYLTLMEKSEKNDKE